MRTILDFSLLCAALIVAATPSAVFAQAEAIDMPPRREIVACPSLADLGYLTKALTEISLDMSATNRLPDDCSVNLFAPAGGWELAPLAQREFTWAASELYAQPSYWDDPILERYGQTHRPFIQPWLSGAHFFGTFPLIPYKIGVDRTHDKIYTLGYYRPAALRPVWAAGFRGKWMRQPLKWQLSCP